MKAIFDYQKLEKISNKFKKKFRKNLPFPHIVIDNFISEEILDKILSEFPKTESSYWKEPTNKHQQKRQMAVIKNVHKIDTFGPFCKFFYYEISSAPFLSFLDKISSISGLVADPYLAGAGFHNTLSGGFLDMHADFSQHDYLKLERRINFLLYLNKKWKKQYAGDIEFYDRNLKCAKRIAPIARRLVVFETSNYSYHGFEKHVKCPLTMSRKAITAYFYSKSRPKNTGTKMHKDIYPKDPDFVVEYDSVPGLNS